jgi:PAS domain-containing protein
MPANVQMFPLSQQESQEKNKTNLPTESATTKVCMVMKWIDTIASLVDMERKFQFFLESMPQIVWTASPTGHIICVNKAWYDYTGMSPMENKDDWINYMHPEDRYSIHPHQSRFPFLMVNLFFFDLDIGVHSNGESVCKKEPNGRSTIVFSPKRVSTGGFLDVQNPCETL